MWWSLHFQALTFLHFASQGEARRFCSFSHPFRDAKEEFFSPPGRSDVKRRALFFLFFFYSEEKEEKYDYVVVRPRALLPVFFFFHFSFLPKTGSILS